MVTIALCSLLVGAVLGARLRVYVLYPASILGLVIVATVAAFKGAAMSSAIMAAIACVISLQIGYLGGLFTPFCMAASRVVFERPLRSTVAGS
jgi:hypothetical protein